MAKMKEIDSGYFLELTESRFSARPFAREIEWWSDRGERVLGVVLLDLVDEDWSWVILGRDEVGQFRGIDLEVSISSCAHARRKMLAKLREYARQSDWIFPQNDN